MKKSGRNYFKASSLCGFIVVLLLTASSAYAQLNAQPYKYLRLTIDELDGEGNSSIKVDKIRWVMGGAKFPLLDLKSFNKDNPSISENDEVYFNSSVRNFSDPAHKVFEDDGFATYLSRFIIKEGVVVGNNLPATFTLNFKKAPIYPTGIELSIVHGTITKFHCEGSNDGSNWDTLYTSPTLDFHDFVGKGRDFNADFGVSLPAIDSRAPDTPTRLKVSNMTAVAADIAWDAVTDDGVGLLAYAIFVDNVLWQTSIGNATTVYGLTQGSSHNIKVTAVDAYGNMSAFSDSEVINTLNGYPEATRKMAIGIGLGDPDANSGVFKTEPDFGGDWRSTNPEEGPFTLAVIEDMKKFSHIRFMNAFGANQSAIVNWEDRVQVNNPKQLIKYHKDNKIINEDILSYEWAIYLCNITDTDMWLNVPGDANESYIRQLAALVKQNLNPDLKVYLENGNETWSPAFHVYHNYKIEAGKLGLGADHNGSGKYAVYKSLRVFEWFNEVFGDQSRVIKVLAGQVANSFLSRNHIEALKDPFINPDGVLPDFYGFASYFDLGDIDGSGFEKMKQSIDKITGGFNKEQYEIWNAEGIDLISYEGGIHMRRGQRSTYNKDKGVYNAYLYYLDKMAYFYQHFTQYHYAGAYNNSYYFGVLDYVGQPLAEAPKFRAVLDWTDVNKDNTSSNDDNPPIILKQLEDTIVPNGVTGVGFSFAALESTKRPILSYKWLRNNAPIIGVNDEKIMLAEIKPSDNGTQYQVEVTNDFGSTLSNVAILKVTDHHLDIAETEIAPIIDGNIDEMWDDYPEQSIGNDVSDNLVGSEADLSGRYKVAWNAEYLYFVVWVTDDVLVKDNSGIDPKHFNYDGIEFYINGNNAFTSSFDRDDTHFSYNWGGDVHSLAVAGVRTAAGIISAQQDTSAGYVMEVAMPWSLVNVHARGKKFFGLDIMIYDNDIPGSKSTTEKIAWHSVNNDTWKDPRKMASVQLVSEFEEEAEIVLNPDLSFQIPAMKYVNNGVEYFYNVDFIFAPRDNKLIFEVANVTELDLAAENALILNLDFSFNVPIMRYVTADGGVLYYNVDFAYSPMEQQLQFEPVKITEIPGKM